jgi:hypothetical protein
VDFVNSNVNPTTAVRMAIAPRLARLLVVVSLAMACATLLATQSKTLAITNVTLIDGTGAKARVVTVIVEGDRITAITRDGQKRIPTGATKVDGRGKYLIPGMWDLHVHIGGYDGGRDARDASFDQTSVARGAANGSIDGLRLDFRPFGINGLEMVDQTRGSWTREIFGGPLSTGVSGTRRSPN